ncbi:GNAT family N-acetyltransferase [Brevibacillus ginsengisoli]|uniref:GNAT family N-acetyltransferase n=1 Tax=Brevibacillus ginsengisoli TaxID=363854 RepID=UPI003CFA5F39
MMIQTFPVKPEDEPFLFNLFATTREEELKACGFDQTTSELFLRMQWRAQQLSYGEAFPDADHRMIWMDSVKVGKIMIHRTEQEIRLVDLILLPQVCHRGIGTQLLRELQQEANQQKKTLTLSVLHTNPALKLYKRLGFIAVGGDEMYDQMMWKG